MKYDIVSRFKNKKCYYGIAIYNNYKVFYKEFDNCLDVKKEIEGYEHVKKYYTIPKLILSDGNAILYEYIESLISRTLYDSIYFNNNEIDYDKIILPIKNSLSNIKLIDENKLSNYKFFGERINKINEYLSNDIYIKYHQLFKDIIENTSMPKKLYSLISQGDPTDTNISIEGVYTDFENGGYNSIVGEISIFVVSILTHGGYFYPKYNSGVYKIRPNYIVSTNITDKNIKLLDLYLNTYKNKLNNKMLEQINEYLKYYLCFRLLTPIDVNNMEESDRKIIFKLLDIFMNINSIEDLIDIIRRWDLWFIKNNQ